MRKLFPQGQAIEVTSSVMRALLSQLSLIYDCLALAKAPDDSPLFMALDNQFCQNEITSSELVEQIFVQLARLDVVDLPLPHLM
jgi:hypothetical protein